ncbi:MAG: hypothetical protein ASARMPRED_003164 [Alectoria sarmentosa]|nr:MAG: hypothetical protein ASARMPRED_003164 [Alectoria sarmentosa]
MAFRFLLVLLACTCFSRLACTAAPPVNVALDQPSGYLDPVGPINASVLQQAALLNASITFNIPGTEINLIFSRFANVISQTELELCIIEGIASLFGAVLVRGKDGFLPLNSVDYKYGNLVINVYDFSSPSFRMTYASVVSTLRGIALFTSLYGYYGMSFEVYQGRTGHVGTGDFGPIIPR